MNSNTGSERVGSRAIEAALPRFDVKASYSVDVAASKAETYTALLSCNFSDSFVVRTLMKLRGYGREIDRVSGDQTVLDNLKRGGFIELAILPEQEIVFGIVGQFWRPTGGLCKLTAKEFAEFNREGFAKAAWNFNLVSIVPTNTRLITETRIQLLGRGAQLKFRLYWLFVGPFSGIIRMAMLRQVKRKAEALSVVPA